MTMTTKLYAMPIIIKDGNFIGFVTRPFTRSEMRESLRSLGFTKDDADCWDADLPTEYEIPSGFDPEAQALAVIQLSGGDWLHAQPGRGRHLATAPGDLRGDRLVEQVRFLRRRAGPLRWAGPWSVAALSGRHSPRRERVVFPSDEGAK